MRTDEPALPTTVVTSSGRDVRRGTPIDLNKLRSLAVGNRTRNVVREGRHADGTRWKSTTDELRTTVTEHAVKGDRVDVLLRPDTVKMKIGVQQ
jgi:hypothetical protein